MTSDASQIEPLHVLPVVIGVIALLLILSMMVSSYRSKRSIRAYRSLTLERHEKEKAFSMDYYYTRHPDRRPKEDTVSGKAKPGRNNKRKRRK